MKLCKRNFRRVKTTLLGSVIATTCMTTSVFALELQGTCDGHDRCTVNIDGDKIYTSSGIDINTDKIIGWTFTNDNNRGGVAFRARNEDYRILIKYFDALGNRKLNQIGFFNFKSAQTFVSSIEIISGLALNHDQAGETTHCTASGKDAASGTDMSGLNSRISAADKLQNVGLGAGVGLALMEGGINTSNAVVGAAGGAIAGQALSNNSGDFNLKRNVISEVRGTPINSKLNLDESFVHLKNCVDQPTISTTNINITKPIPIKNR